MRQGVRLHLFHQLIFHETAHLRGATAGRIFRAIFDDSYDVEAIIIPIIRPIINPFDDSKMGF